MQSTRISLIIATPISSGTHTAEVGKRASSKHLEIEGLFVDPLNADGIVAMIAPLSRAQRPEPRADGDADHERHRGEGRIEPRNSTQRLRKRGGNPKRSKARKASEKEEILDTEEEKI
ncbi:hypothetical protein NL676_001797 [Syzygium grande]|nr:hypothetical protein NL676_001797 [Syzygium grande]